MTSFVSSVGTKLAERWLSLLVLPGLLFIATAVVGGHLLTQTHWDRPDRLRQRMDQLAADHAMHSNGTVALLAVVVLLGSAGIGLAAQQLGGGIEWIWLGDWGGPLSRTVTARRLRRWMHADETYGTALVRRGQLQLMPELQVATQDQTDIRTLLAARDRIALMRPQRPTWIGDRMLAADVRIYAAYDLDLAVIWPRLWLTVPDSTRSEVRLAHDTFTGAARLAAWGLLYVILAAWWWPAIVIGVSAMITGWRRGRSSMNVFADLVESTVDRHARDLAEALGVDCAGPFSRDTGGAVAKALRKD